MARVYAIWRRSNSIALFLFLCVSVSLSVALKLSWAWYVIALYFCYLVLFSSENTTENQQQWFVLFLSILFKKLGAYCAFAAVVQSTLLPSGCIAIVDSSDFWICYLVLFVKETSKVLTFSSAKNPTQSFNPKPVLIFLILLRAFFLSREDHERKIPTLLRLIAMDGASQLLFGEINE